MHNSLEKLSILKPILILELLLILLLLLLLLCHIKILTMLLLLLLLLLNKNFIMTFMTILYWSHWGASTITFTCGFISSKLPPISCTIIIIFLGRLINIGVRIRYRVLLRTIFFLFLLLSHY